VRFIAGQSKASPNAAFAGSVPYLMLAGNLMAGWQLAAFAAGGEDLLAKGEGQGLHASQDRHRALLRPTTSCRRRRGSGTASSMGRMSVMRCRRKRFRGLSLRA
jgi:hypothetical protein